jgi:hypothetical protein
MKYGERYAQCDGAYFEALLTGDQLALAMAQKKTAYTSKLDAAKNALLPAPVPGPISTRPRQRLT